MSTVDLPKKLEIETLVVTEFAQNARIVWDANSSRALIIDPGGEVERIAHVIDTRKLDVEGIFLTHSHIDHAGGVAQLLELYSRSGKALRYYAHPSEAFLREHIAEQAMFFGLSSGAYRNAPEPTEVITDGMPITIGSVIGHTIFSPGHSPGHFAILFRDLEWSEFQEGVKVRSGTEDILIAGDALFQGSIGRSDLPGGNHEQLLESIRTRFLPLDEATIVFPGHGPATTIGDEKRNNPFLV